jgi:uncharacterized delta-60 repeat protein
MKNKYLFKVAFMSASLAGLLVIAGCSGSGGGVFSVGTTHSAGSLDSAGFNAAGTYPGMVTTDVDPGTSHQGYANAVAIQGDAKIVTVGYAYHGGHPQFAVARYNTNGLLDTTFNPAGIVPGVQNTQIGNGSHALAVAIQSDQKIVVAGWSGDGASPNVTSFALARYNTDGSLDTTFGTIGDGTVIEPLSTTDAEAHAIAIQSNGMIVVAGYVVITGQKVFTIARYTTAGVLDTTGFNAGGLIPGVFVYAPGADDAEAFALAIQPADQKIIVAGYTHPASLDEFIVMRLTTAGIFDTTFNTSGTTQGIVNTAIGTSSSYAYSVALQADGKIVVAGSSWNGSNNDFAVARYTTLGVLDPGFGTGGTLTTNISVSGGDWAHAVAIQPGDQKIVAAGVAQMGANLDFALVRYNTNGTLDTSFGTGGKVTTSLGTGTDNEAYGLAIQSDGKIVAVGRSYDGSITSFAVVRYWP